MVRRLRFLETWIVLLSLVALLVLVPLREVSGALPALRFAGAIWLFLVPGLLVSRWLLREYFSGATLVPVGFAISTAVFGVVAVPMLVLHRSPELYLWVAGAIVAGFLVAAVVVAFRRRLPEGEARNPFEPATAALWAPFGFLGGLLVFASRVEVPLVDGDTWNYLAWVREFLTADRLALYNPYFGDEVSFSRIQINGWFMEQAALARVSGIEPVDMVLYYLAPTLVIVSLLAFYALARVLFKSEAAALFVGSIYALFLLVNLGLSIGTSFGGEFIGRMVQDKFFARFVFLPVILALAAVFLEGRKLKYLAVFAFLCAAVVAVHPIALAVIGLSVAGLGFVHLAANFRRRRAWTGAVSLGLGLFGVLLPPALFLLAAGISPATAAYPADIGETPPEVLANQVFVRTGWKNIYELGGGLYIMHPYILLTPAIAAAYLVGVPFLLWRVKRSLSAQLILGVLLAATVVSYVPPVATFVGDEIIAPGQLYRMAWPIPLAALLAVGWMAWEATTLAARRLRRRGSLRRTTKFLPLVLVLVLVVAAAPVYLPNVKAVYDLRDVPPEASFLQDPIFYWMTDNIQEESVILAPDFENLAIPAYSENLDVVSFRGAPVLDNLEALEEQVGGEIEVPQSDRDVQRFYTGATVEEVADIILRYEADYVLVLDGLAPENELQQLPGVSAVDTPGERYNLYSVDRSELGND